MPDWNAIETAFESAVAEGAVAGVAATIGDAGGTLWEGAAGQRGLGGTAAMTPDTVVWIASMTKAVTGAAAMQMVERGHLSLDAPAAQWLPELGQVQVLEGFDAAGQPQLRPARGAITLRNLLSHTAGYSYNIWNAEIGRYLEATDTPPITTCKRAALTTPLVRDPDAAWEYGIGIDWAGRLVEEASGQRLGDYLRANLLGPLGMGDTGFRLNEAMRGRLAGMHARGADGALTPIPFEMEQAPEFEMGGGGLYGTVRDYLLFCRMILNQGRAGGEAVLKPETVAEMAHDQIAGLPMTPLVTALPSASNDAAFFPGLRQGWGLTWLINHEATPEGRSPGSLAWAGLANTYYWIDPARGIAGVFATQILPFFDAPAIGLFRAFEREAYRALG